MTDLMGRQQQNPRGTAPTRLAAWPLFGTLAILDPALAVHSARGASLALALAAEMGVETSAAQAFGFLLRDLGALEVPDQIARKPGPLTEDERGVISGHPLRSAGLLSEVDGLDEAVAIVRHHHERWDGGGYPHRLREQEVPLHARMLALGDTYAALTAPRPHRQAVPMEKALESIEAEAGRQFDPALTWVFIELVRSLDVPYVAGPSVQLPGEVGVTLTRISKRAKDLSRGQLEAMFSVAIGLGGEEAAKRCGRSPGTHRNWVSSLRRSLACPPRQPLPQFMARIGAALWQEIDPTAPV